MIAPAHTALMNTLVMTPGSHPKALYSGDLRVCNDSESTGSLTVHVRPEGMVYLEPGECMDEWGPMLTLVNDGSGIVIVHYRSISKNNGRVPGKQESPAP